jgi:electron transport complex protein RnfC
VVTVTGRCVREPGNLLVKIGTPVGELIGECGGLKGGNPAKIIMGGPMMGLAQPTADVPVIKGTSGILVFTAGETPVPEPGPCIFCGRCIRSCPMGLLPNYICAAVEKERFDLARDYGAPDCFECGVCSYVCPAKRRLTESAKYAKLRISKKQRQ